MSALRQRFPARAEALPRVTAFVERRCLELGAGRRAALRLILVAEELFINTVLHGYGGKGRQAVTLTVRDAGAGIELVAEDGAPPFDPFRRVARPDLAGGAAGGLGRLLIAGVSSRHSYERRGRRNRVTVVVPKHDAGLPRAARPRKK